MVIDWNKIALDEGIDALAEFLRGEWGVWVGIIDHAGLVTPLGDARVESEHPLCACFKANPLRDVQGESLRSCSRTLVEWGDLERPVRGALPCHAGLQAILSPVMLDGERVATLYASGFINTRDESRQLTEIRQRAHRIARASEQVKLSWVELVPRVNASQEAVIQRLLDATSERVSTRLAEQVALGTTTPAARNATSFSGMIGASPGMRSLFHMIRRVARSHATVLILGENGTGKELVARAVHAHSTRQHKPYIVQNCAAIPADLIESELFGHKRGAFSGAHRDREGLFSASDHGTFFLDEIGEMDVTLQAKLLRVLQEGTFLPVGDSVFRKVDVRVICATNRDLRGMVSRGEFREDLFFRINVITLEIPALRDRPEDIPLLAEHFLTRACRAHGRGIKHLDPECVEHLVAYRWPGNVRELENEIERVVILSGDLERITPDLLSPQISGAKPRPFSFAMSNISLPDAVEQLERQMILASLQSTDWNKTQTAKELGISRRNLIRKVARFDFEEPP